VRAGAAKQIVKLDGGRLLNQAGSEIRAVKPSMKAWCISVACTLIPTFWWTAHWMVERWEQTNSYYSHGWLIPLVSAFLLYRMRRRIAACPRRPCAWGLWLLVPSILMHLLGVAWQVGFVSGFALLGVLAGITLTLFGPAMLRTVWFPIAFLLFMVPVPVVLIEKISFNMKLLAARAATTIVDLFGLIAVRQGSYIRIHTGVLVVDDVCSGLKYLISLMAFGAVYSHVSQVKRWGKAALFVLSIPISFIANVGRVTLMVMVAHRYGVEAAEKWYFHDLFGFALFIIAFVLMFALESLMLAGRRLSLRSRKEKAATGDDHGADSDFKASRCDPPSRRLNVSVLGVLVLAAILSVHLSWPRATIEGTAGIDAVPLAMGPWHGVDITLDERVYDILGTRDVLSRVYRRDDGPAVQLMVVIAQQTRKRTHPPEQCFKGEGYLIEGQGKRVVELQHLSTPMTQQVHELVLNRNGVRRVAWYYFKSGERISTSYWFHQATLAMRKLTRPDSADVLVRVDTVAMEPDAEGARRALGDFLSDATDSLNENLP